MTSGTVMVGTWEPGPGAQAAVRPELPPMHLALVGAPGGSRCSTARTTTDHPGLAQGEAPRSSRYGNPLPMRMVAHEPWRRCKTHHLRTGPTSTLSYFYKKTGAWIALRHLKPYQKMDDIIATSIHTFCGFVFHNKTLELLVNVHATRILTAPRLS